MKRKTKYESRGAERVRQLGRLVWIKKHQPERFEQLMIALAHLVDALQARRAS